MIQVNFPKEGGQTAFTYSFQECTGSQDVSFEFADPVYDDWLDLTASSGSLTISASTNGTTDSRTGRININVNGTPCDNYFDISQAGSACDCLDVKFVGGVTSATWVWNDTSWQTIEFYGERGCSINVSSVSSPSHFTGETVNGTSVRFKPTGNNASAGEYDENATVTISIGGKSCTKTVSLTQYNRGVTCTTVDCNCYEYRNASITDAASLTCNSTAATLSFEYTQYRIVRTEDCTVTKTQQSIGTTSTTVTFASNAGGTTSVPRSGTFVWTDRKTCGDGECGSSDISIPWNLTLPACPAPTCTTSSCTCYMVGAATSTTVTSTATSATVTWPYSAITWTTASTCDVSSSKTEGTSSTTVTFAAATCDSYTKNGSFTWSNHKACGTNGCSSSDVSVSWSVTQTRPAGCDCSCGVITADSRTWASTEYGSGQSRQVLKIDDCCTIQTACTNNNFTVTTASTGGYKYVYAYPSTENTSTTQKREGTVSVTATCGSDTCTSSSTITQNTKTCTPASCTCYLVGTATSTTVTSTATSATVTWPYSAITWTTASTCDVSSSKTEGTSSTTVTFAAATCSDYTKNGSFTWSNHKACGTNSCTSNDVSVSWVVNQNRPSDCDCTCGNLTVTAASNIAATGGSSVTLGTISDGDCVKNISISSISYNGSESGWLSNTNSGSSISGTFTLTGNVSDWSSRYETQARTATVTVTGTANGSSCTKTFTITQNAAGCTCQNAFITATTETLPAKITAGDTVTVWKIEKNCGTVEAVCEGNCLSSSGTYESGGYTYVSARTNSNLSSSCTFRVGYQLKVDGSVCPNATGMSTDITVVPALDCDCDDLIPITSNGDELDWTDTILFVEDDESCRFTYKYASGKEDCFEGVTISYDWEDEDNAFTISTGTTGGKTYVDVRVNPMAERGQYATIYFNYVMADGTDCENMGYYVSVEFNPACVCENLLPSDACIQRQVSTAAGTYDLGTFGVEGCGEFSGKSTSSQVDKVIIRSTSQGYDVSVKLYQFTPTTSQPDAPIDIDIYSLASGQALENCHHIYRIWQREDYVDYNRIMDMVFDDSTPTYTARNDAFLALLRNRHTGGIYAYSGLTANNVITGFSTKYSWIDASTLHFDYWSINGVYIRGNIEANQSAQPRTNEITVHIDRNALKTYYGICNFPYDSFTYTVTQSGDPSYACTCPADKTYEIRYFGGEASFYCDYVLNSCFASSGLKYIAVDFSNPGDFYNDYVAVTSWLSVKFEITSDASAPNKSRLMVSFKALANTDTTNDRTYTLRVKVNFDSSQADECIQDVVFHQEEAINVTCQELLDAIDGSILDIDPEDTRDYFAWMSPRLMEGVRLSGVTVQSQGCDTSWITSIEPGTGNNSHALYLNFGQNISTQLDHSTNERCAKIRIFYIDAQGERLKINGVECGSVDFIATQKGYSGDCMACADATPILPGANYSAYADTTYTEAGITYAAFYEGDGQTDRPLFEISIPSGYYYRDIDDATRCFDLIAKTTHTGSFTPYSDGEYLHVELDLYSRKWVIHGKIKPTSEPVHAVAVEVYLQRRHLSGGDSTQCPGTAYITDFVILNS